MQKHILKNGLTVLLSPISHVRSVAIGIYAKTGSANEVESQSGISHFIEHMLFKGTTKRTAKEIASAIEGKGGMLNAYTNKEETCYYARVIDTEFVTALEVLADMYQNSKFDPDEIELEKGVVLEEIARAQDDPEGYIHGLFAASRWKGFSHGREILGNPESVNALNSSILSNHMKFNYTASETVISIAGNFDVNIALEEIKKQFGDLSYSPPTTYYHKVSSSIESITIQQDSEQAFFA